MYYTILYLIKSIDFPIYVQYFDNFFSVFIVEDNEYISLIYIIISICKALKCMYLYILAT